MPGASASVTTTLGVRGSYTLPEDTCTNRASGNVSRTARVPSTLTTHARAWLPPSPTAAPQCTTASMCSGRSSLASGPSRRSQNWWAT